MRCSVCQSINEDGANFCRSCGTAMAQLPHGSLPPPAPPRHSPDPLWAQTVPSTSPDPQWADSTPAPMDEPQYHEPYPEAIRDAAAAPTLAVPVETAGASVDLRRTVSAELASRRRRNRALLVVGAIVVVTGCVVLAALALDRESKSTASTDPAADSLSPVVTTTIAPIGATTIAPATFPPVAPATTQSPTTLSPTTALAVVVSPPLASAAPTSTSAPTATTVAATAATVPATVAPTTTPVSPVTTVTTVATTPSSPTPASNGDLGLTIPISKPPCDGQYITLIGASVDTPGVGGRVQGLLDQYPGSKYLKTELVCGSLSPRSADGKALYIVFFGPYATTADACSARAKGTKDSYVKVLENAPEPTGAVKC